MGKGYCDQGIFLHKISEIVNESCSIAYIVDSWDVWYSRLGHVNSLYVMKLQKTQIN